VYLTFRWFGPPDPIPLAYIRQVPGVEGIVTALYDLVPGVEWPLESLRQLRDRIEDAGLRFAVVESIPIHEDIKLGNPGRDRWIDNFARSVRNVAEVGVKVVCYNFMPVFDWSRTGLDMRLEDGSSALAFDQRELDRFDLARDDFQLPGWFAPDSATRLSELAARYVDVDDERLWENLAHFLEGVIPVAEEAGVRMALHPDDPPWSIFGLPRIITDRAALARVVRLVDSPANGLTFCTGSLGALPRNDLPAMIREFGDRVHFVHCRNVRVTGEERFHETPHPTRYGDVDMLAVMRALRDVGFAGPARPDHGRMIWGEQGRPGYGLFDRALGAAYLNGLWEGVTGESEIKS
jgi:mannonate dehydratase